MQPCNKPYGLLSVFSFILSGASWLVYLLVTTAGYLATNGANNLSNAYDIDLTEAQKIFDLYLKYQEEQYSTFFDWTVGSYNNVVGGLAILFAVMGVVLAIACFCKNKKD
jgi:hypothetical protein